MGVEKAARPKLSPEEVQALLSQPQYAPFVRHDMYGTCGNLHPKALLTKVRLALAAVLLLPLKAVLMTACIVFYFLVVLLITSVMPKSKQFRLLAFFGRLHCRVCLVCLGFISVRWVRLVTDKSQASQQQRYGALVSNHSSWVDIILFMSKFFPSFVAKSATNDLPLVGTIARATQCLFVDREARLAANAAVGQGTAAQIATRMKSKYNGDSDEPHLLLFPEGTTTNNRYILPFRSGGFVAGVPVQPVVIKYKTGRVSPCWDGITGPNHLFYMLTEPFFSVTAYILPVYTPSAEEVCSPALYAANVRAYMLKYSKLLPTDASFKDKLEFYEKLNMERHKPAAASAANGTATAVVHAKAE